MNLALALFPDIDGLDGLIEQSMPWFIAWLVTLALLLIGLTAFQLVQHFRLRSPVEKLLRKRFG